MDEVLVDNKIEKTSNLNQQTRGLIVEQNNKNILSPILLVDNDVLW